MREIGHFIGGKEVAGTSGRTGDVFNPNTGEVQAKVALASEIRGRAGDRQRRGGAAGMGRHQPAAPRPRLSNSSSWRRRNSTAWRSCSRPSTARPSPTPRATSSAALEVVEFACGIPHLLKGEFTEGAGPGIDLYSMRQPLGVVAGITPFNFPAMIPMWKFAPAIACGNAFILKPSERDPSRADAACRAADRGRPAGGRAQRRQRRQGSGRHAAHRSARPGDRLRRLDRRSPNTSIRPAARTANACSASAAPRTT